MGSRIRGAFVPSFVRSQHTARARGARSILRYVCTLRAVRGSFCDNLVTTLSTWPKFPPRRYIARRDVLCAPHVYICTTVSSLSRRRENCFESLRNLSNVSLLRTRALYYIYMGALSVSNLRKRGREWCVYSDKVYMMGIKDTYIVVKYFACVKYTVYICLIKIDFFFFI